MQKVKKITKNGYKVSWLLLLLLLQYENYEKSSQVIHFELKISAEFRRHAIWQCSSQISRRAALAVGNSLQGDAAW